ncbi:Mov34/MPN/PAD-1 family protein [Paenibacillus sp. UNC499MF]|uniref:Mov34/MPN/PAD-1 family protein n=1 Tax=Paenibacillus sp. UNC499MF TaxID=1502751 RepID=UPI0021562A2C|nr:Mov34/MPN/PAD-1 family protein [Paenibacillus sp. UNC499MF]
MNANRLTEIKVSPSLYTEWLERFGGFPAEEACGFVYGKIRKQTAYVSSFAWVANVSEHPTRSFRMSPSDIMIHLGGGTTGNDRRAEASEDPVLLGLFHSHPRTPALPSHEDVSAFRLWPELPSFWIVSLERSVPQTAVYAWEEPLESGSGASPGPSESSVSANKAVTTVDTGQIRIVSPSVKEWRTDRIEPVEATTPFDQSDKTTSLSRLRVGPGRPPRSVAARAWDSRLLRKIPLYIEAP